MRQVGTTGQLVGPIDLKGKKVCKRKCHEYNMWSKDNLLSCWLMDRGLFTLGGIPPIGPIIPKPAPPLTAGAAACCGGLLNRAIMESFDIWLPACWPAPPLALAKSANMSDVEDAAGAAAAVDDTPTKSLKSLSFSAGLLVTAAAGVGLGPEKENLVNSPSLWVIRQRAVCVRWHHIHIQHFSRLFFQQGTCTH